MKIQDKDIQGLWQAITNLHVVTNRDEAPYAERDGTFPTGENFMWGVSTEKPEAGMWAMSVDRTGFTLTSEEGDEETWYVDVKSPDHARKLILSGEFFRAMFS